VVWDAGNGWWGQMLVPAALADRVDGLIAAIGDADAQAATPAPVPGP
jgi:hypothetical protein